MEKKKYPLLLTGTIDSRAFDGDGIDLEKRLKSYEDAVQRYITETAFNPVVFIENSGYPFDSTRFETLANQHGKNFEFINGTICKDEVKEHGKGYGDSLLVYEGLTNSRLLKDEQFFYKITGRLFLKNWKKVIASCEKHRNEFISYDGMGWVLTYLFKANKSDYLLVMENVYLQCDDRSLRDMEICFWMRLYSSDLDVGCFCTYPVIEGTMGVSNIPYTKGAIDTVLRTIGAKIGIFTLKSKPSRVFWGMYQKVTGRKPYVDLKEIEG